MPGPTLTYLLDQLEKSGVVERHDCPDDGRAYRVRLTRLGRSLEQQGHNSARLVLSPQKEHAEDARRRRKSMRSTAKALEKEI